MSDYIKREDAIAKFITNGSATVYGIDRCKAIISRLQLVPSADVIEVVRCMDCKHYISDGGALMICEITEMNTNDCDYCSYGERAEA
jgi:plasmid maintenance system killer protein